jgi:hypothetical protein
MCQKVNPPNLLSALFLNFPTFWLPKTYMPSECHPSNLSVCLPASSPDVCRLLAVCLPHSHLPVCLSVTCLAALGRLTASQLLYLPACLTTTCLSVSQPPACLSLSHLPVCLSATCLSVCQPPACLSLSHLPVCLSALLLSCVFVDLSFPLLAFIFFST